MRSAARNGAKRVGGALLTAVVLGVFGELFIKYAEQQGLYSDPKRTLEAALSWLWWIAFNPVSLLLYGFSAGVWFDALFRRAATGTPMRSETTALVRASEGERTFVRLLIDFSNFRTEILERSNVFDAKGICLDDLGQDVRLFIVFDRPAQGVGLRITADNKLDGYYTQEEAVRDRYALCTLHGIKSPCIITVELRSETSSRPEDGPLTPLLPPSSEA